MSYKTGFKELSELEEKKFLQELGLSKGQLESGMKRPQPWAGVPAFKAPVDIWIDDYRAYAASLSPQEKGALHRSINRLFFSLKEGRFVSQADHRRNRARYKRQYIIPEKMKSGPEAKLWLKLAGSYTHAVMKKRTEEQKGQRAARFLVEMPVAWLDHEAAGYTDQIQKRAFAKFVGALSKHWLLFIDSYRNEVHGTVINNSPHAASLQSFVRGHYPDGRPLRRPHPLVYWPQPLIYYATKLTARELFEAKKAEVKALKPTLSQGAGGETTIYYFPRWLRLGVDGVDPRPRPPAPAPP